MPKYETQIINGTEYKIIWEVLNENGRVVEETISEAWALGIIEDEGKHGEWDINDRLEEVKENVKN